MSKPVKTKRDLLAAMEDDIRQFRDALFKALGAGPPCDRQARGADHSDDQAARDFPQREGLTVCAQVRKPRSHTSRAIDFARCCMHVPNRGA